MVIATKLALGTVFVGKGAWIYGKAWLAQVLLAHAWERVLAGERDVKPWPWADTWPVARLLAPRHDVQTLVLEGGSGRTLAFGPGHLSGSAAPGRPGNCVVFGHRDTHLTFARDVVKGDELFLETPSGVVYRYVVTDRRIVHEKETWVMDPVPGRQLTLITCYPFDAVRPGGPLRFVITAAM